MSSATIQAAVEIPTELTQRLLDRVQWLQAALQARLARMKLDMLTTGDLRPLQGPDLATLLRNPERVAEVPLARVPPLLVELAAVQITLAARLASAPVPADAKRQPEPADRLLTPKEAAAVLGTTTRWLYRHAGRLPFTRRLSRKSLRFSEVGLRRWMAVKRGH